MTDPWAYIAMLAAERRAKAVTGPGVISMTYDPPLTTSYGASQQQRMAAYLKAYRVGWFYKAEHRIATDFASLGWHVSAGDDDEGDEQDSLPTPDLYVPFASLSPIEQFMRLLERPNPQQTGRQLFEKSMIRLDMAGTTFLYLEGAPGLPTAIYGISPTRMTPSRDKAGNLIGWVMDLDRNGIGVPFDAAEIVKVAYGSPDDDVWGVGVVEAVEAQVPLSGLMSRHIADVLTTGGRLAGMLTPKDRTLTEDEFTDVQRAWRNVASDPHAARRLLLFPEPMEWTAAAAKPEEIGIPELANLNRDDILSAFPISPYMLGVPMPGGLNSGELRKQERKDYWEGTIHPRVDLWEEAIKVDILALYEGATGQTFDFDFEEPNLDDAASLTEKAAALRELWDLGFDEKGAIEAVGLDGIKWNGRPEPEPVVIEQPVEPPPPDEPVVKAVKTRQERRAEATEAAVAEGLADLRRFFAEQRERIAANIRATMPARKALRKASPDDWWREEVEDKALREAMRGLYAAIGREALQVVADDLDRVIGKSQVGRVLEGLVRWGGQGIKRINDTTRDALVREIAEGTRRGYSVTQLVEGVPAEGFRGVLDAGLDNGVGVWDELRAETIARTESMRAWNRAAIESYKDFGVTELLAYDGDYDDVCQARDGLVFTIEEAMEEMEAEHPNGTLGFSPVMDKAAHMEPPVPTIVQNFFNGPDGMKALDFPAPVVNVPAPIVNVEAPVVNVAPPDLSTLKVPAPVVVVDNVRVTSLPDREHRVIRDRNGKPTGSVEVDA